MGSPRKKGRRQRRRVGLMVARDPTAVGPDRIAGLEVVATIVDGELRCAANAFRR
jgi:hypothetical protein